MDAIYLTCEKARCPIVTGNASYTVGDWWRALLLVGLTTGMRRGELLTLLWDDVHLDDGYLVVRGDEAKGKRDDRIPLNPIVSDHLRVIQDVGLCVFEWDGSERALLDEFRFIQKQAGVDSNYGFHALKKSCGTLNAPRMTETELNKFMRHTSVETTRAYYQNRDEIMRGAAEKVYVPGVARRR